MKKLALVLSLVASPAFAQQLTADDVTTACLSETGQLRTELAKERIKTASLNAELAKEKAKSAELSKQIEEAKKPKDPPPTASEQK